MKMFKYWKKSMVAAGILATLLAGSAFAATEAEDAATQQSGQDYNQKIEQQVPGTEKGRPFRSYKDGHHKPGPRHHKLNGHHGGPGKHHVGRHQARHRDDLGRPGRDRERREATEMFISRVNEERTKNMTDAEKAHFEKRQAAKKAERDKIAKMTEDERHDYFKKKHDEMVNARIKNMTPEEKKRFLERDKRQQERMEAFWKKWKQMTPEEKEQWKKAHHRFGPGPGQGAPGGPRGAHRPHNGQGPKAAAPAQA